MITNLLHEEVQQVQSIRKIRQSNLDDVQKRIRITEIRTSNLDEKITSWEVIISTINPMLGSTTLVVPVIFSQVGMFLGIFTLIVLCLINYATGRLLLKASRETESELEEVIERLMGKKAVYLYSLISSILMYLVSIIYFLLMCNNTHGTLKFILNKYGCSVTPKDQIFFDQYSYQYTVLICSVIIFSLINLKNLDTIMKLGRYGFITIFMFLMFILIKFIKNLVDITENHSISDFFEQEMLIFTSNISTSTGSLALSFLMQNSILIIYRKHKDQSNNCTTLFKAYISAFFIYIYIGVLGYIAMLGRRANNGVTILDFYGVDDILVLILTFSYAVYLSLILPFLMAVSKNQFFNLFYDQLEDIPRHVEIIFNSTMMIFGVICGIFDYNPIQLLALTGALAGFFISYYYPIVLYLINLNKKDQESLLSKENSDSIKKINDSLFSHTQKQIKQQYLIYGCVMSFGIYVLVIQLLSLF